jgi:integrase
VPDPELPAHYGRVYPTGSKSYVVVKAGKWFTIGDARVFTIEQAREKARVILRGDGATEESVEEVVKTYRERRVDSFRSRRVVVLSLDRFVEAFPGRAFVSVKRQEIATLADRICDKHGRRSASYFLSVVSALCNWYEDRHDTYTSPITAGMKRAFGKRSRARILSDEELKAIWEQAELQGDAYGAAIRILLLTGQRREKVLRMQWDDISGNVWTIKTEEREKNNAGLLILPQIAVDVINSLPRINRYVFAAERSGGCRSAVTRLKSRLDAATGVHGWVVHDLRRTARSLMSRAGVRPDIAERVLGHVQQGVLGVYDRHQYREEKRDALTALANLIKSIVDPGSTDNVVPMVRSA